MEVIFFIFMAIFIENGHFWKTELKIQKSAYSRKSKYDQGSIFDSRKLKLGKKILPGDS